MSATLCSGNGSVSPATHLDTCDLCTPQRAATNSAFVRWSTRISMTRASLTQSPLARRLRVIRGVVDAVSLIALISRVGANLAIWIARDSARALVRADHSFAAVCRPVFIALAEPCG